jgi:hypothetical protein
MKAAARGKAKDQSGEAQFSFLAPACSPVFVHASRHLIPCGFCRRRPARSAGGRQPCKGVCSCARRLPEIGKVFGRQEHLDRAGLTGLPAEESPPFQRENHLVNRRRRRLKIPLEIGLCRQPPVDFRIVVNEGNEGDLLSLLGGVGPHPRRPPNRALPSARLTSLEATACV